MVVAELRRAREALRATESLTRDSLHADAISRAYYPVLHADKAALFVHDIAAENHAAVRRLFGLYLCGKRGQESFLEDTDRWPVEIVP